MSSAWVPFLALAMATGCAAKQPVRSFSDLPQRVKSGHTVSVSDDAGSETKGKVVAVLPSELTLDVEGERRPIGAASVRQVHRHGDSLWNGAVIGLVVGGGSLLMSDAPRRSAPCQNDPQRQCDDFLAGQRVIALAVMGAVGAGIDALIRGRHLVYVAPVQPPRSVRRIVISPSVGTSSAGVFVRLDLNQRRQSPTRVDVSGVKQPPVHAPGHTKRLLAFDLPADLVPGDRPGVAP